MADMRTPLKTVRGFGSARTGTGHFWHQRLTAIANIPLIVFFLGIVIALAGKPYGAVIATLSIPIVAILLILAILSVSYHMYLGVQVVIEDYVHDEGRRTALVVANLFFTMFVALASIFAVVRISFLVPVLQLGQ